MRRLEVGNKLVREDQRHVLAAYTHRYTGDHKPAWANKHPTTSGAHFANDQEWLENTAFNVRKDGRLDMRYKQCYSCPTWPKLDKKSISYADE